MRHAITVATIDNHAVVRDGLTFRVNACEDLSMVASVASVEEYAAAGVSADVVLLDLLLADGDSTGHIPTLTGAGSRVLLYTTEERPVPLRRAVEAGATGVVLKSDPVEAVPVAIRDAMAGEFCCSGPLAHALLHNEAAVADLSERQVEVLQALDEGLDYRATARSLGISEGVVKTHLARVREKYRSRGLDPGNAHHLTKLASDEGYLR